nr:hypothetical protein [Armatimonas sp.]
MSSNNNNETVDGQHINPDGETDAKKGAKLGGAGGAVVGAVAGSAVGPLGTILGAVIGGVTGAASSGIAVAAVDKVDDDDQVITTNDDVIVPVNDDLRNPVLYNPAAGIQTGGYAADGTRDTRGLAEKAADALTDNRVDDKTGKSIEGLPPVIDNGIPGIQTGGRNADGSRDTRGITEKVADGLTGDQIDDKTRKRVN